MVLAVVHMAPLTMPSASPERTIMVPAPPPREQGVSRVEGEEACQSLPP